MEWRSFEEVISFAIGKEQEAVELYERAQGLVELPHVKAMFKEMAAEERGHKAKLEKATQEKVEGYTPKAVPNLKISDYLVEVPLGPDMNYQDVLILGMKEEEQAYKLYSDMAARSESAELKKLFQMLAQEEAKHKLNLETEYDERILTEN